jgi:hypothetical protein
LVGEICLPRTKFGSIARERLANETKIPSGCAADICLSRRFYEFGSPVLKKKT